MEIVTFEGEDYKVMAWVDVAPGVNAHIFETPNGKKAGKAYKALLTYPEGPSIFVFAVNFPVYHLEGETPMAWKFILLDDPQAYEFEMQRHVEAFEDHSRLEFAQLWRAVTATVGYNLFKDPRYQRIVHRLELQTRYGGVSWHDVFKAFKSYLHLLIAELLKAIPDDGSRKKLESFCKWETELSTLRIIVHMLNEKVPAEILGIDQPKETKG